MTNKEMFEKMMTLDVPKPKTNSVSNTGKYSFGIVNSKKNGKRLSFSKALSNVLGLTDKVTLMPNIEDGKVVICRTLVFPQALKGILRNEGSKICYNTALVERLSEDFFIDFSNRVSYTFTDIEIDEFNGVPVAIVTFPKTEVKDTNQNSDFLANESGDPL